MTTPSYSAKQVRLAAKEHAAAMQGLYDAINRVSITMGTLAGILDNAAGEPIDHSGLLTQGEAACESLSKAYAQAVAVFDDPPADDPKVQGT